MQPREGKPRSTEGPIPLEPVARRLFPARRFTCFGDHCGAGDCLRCHPYSAREEGEE